MTSLHSPDGVEKPYTTQNYDIEANKPVNSPTTSTFPGTTYGFEPSDQPSQPPRRISSIHSLKRNRSMTSLRTDPNSVAAASQHPLPPAIPSTYQPQGQPQYQQDTHPPPQADQDQQSQPEELAWGPSHPCFPHLNPHVPLDSPQYITTRIIRIRRDWMIAGDLAPTFSNIYPEILDPLISETEFRRIIHHINTTLLDAFDPFSVWNWFDGLLGLLTGWLWEDFRPKSGLLSGGVKGKLAKLENWIEQWNERVGARDGVRLISLRRTGYVGFDIEIPDPQVKVVEENENETAQGPEVRVRDGEESVDGDGDGGEPGDAVTNNGSIAGYGIAGQ